MKRNIVVAAVLLVGLVGLCNGAEQINFEWKSPNYGKPGFVQGGRIQRKYTPGKGSCGIAHKGKPRATIILAVNPTRSAQIAAKELQYYVEKISGARLRIASENIRPLTGYKVLVGESKLTKKLGLTNDSFEDQEYLIRSYGEILVLMGRDEQEFGMIDYEGTGLWPEFSSYYEWKRSPEPCKKIGTIYAVDEFLQRSLGVRWFMPGEIGEVYPKSPTLSAANLDLKLKPWSDKRWYGPQNFRDYFNFIGSDKPDISYPQRYGLKGWRAINLYMMRMKVFGSEAFMSNHSLIGDWFKKRPETTADIWNQIKAKGYGEDTKQLCLTSKKLFEILVQDAKNYLAGKTNYERSVGRYMPLMAHDYGGQWCKCADCQKYFRNVKEERAKGFWNGAASNYAWTLVDKMARRMKKELPGMWATNCAYAEYTMPPDFELSDNVATLFCRVLPEYFKHPDYKEFAQKWLREWSKRVDRLYIWEYFDHIQMNGKESFFPGIFLDEIEDDMRFLRSINVKGAFNELNSARSCVPNFAQDHLNLYVWLKLLSQDRKADIKAKDLFEDYCKKFYGPAAKPMKAFFTLAEERFVNPANWKLQGEQVSADWEVICPPAVLKQFEKLIDDAALLAKEDPYKVRIKLMREAYYGMMEKNCLKHQNFLKHKKKVVVERLPSGRKAFDGNRNNMGEFVTITGEKLNPTAESWVDYDENFLYVRVKCYEDDFSKIARKVKPSENRGAIRNIFGDDSVEVFINVDRKNPHQYFQFAANLNKALWEARWNRPQPADYEFRSGTKISVTEGKNYWMIDFAIPLKALKGQGAIQPGETWWFNICRNRHRRKSNVRYWCWSPTMASFHEVRRFGTITFK